MSTPSYFVSVKDAIHAGRMNLKYIPLGIIICASIISMWTLGLWFNKSEPLTSHPVLLNPFTISLAGLLLAGAWRSWFSAEWKTWAYENVQDIHRLYQIATDQGMIAKRGSWLNNFEKKTADQKLQLAELEKRLDEPRQMETFNGIPVEEEKEYPWTVKNTLLNLVLAFAFILIVPNLIGAKFAESFPFGLFSTLIVVGFLFKWVPKYGKPAPVRLSKTHLTILENPPVHWKDITNIFLENRRQGKSTVKFLVVETSVDPAKMEVETTDITGTNEALEQELYEYWTQGKKNKSDS